VKNIRDIDIRGKKVLIRVDFNVPLDGQGNITDDTRIRGVLPTINHALDENARIIIMSHMGRPKGQRKGEFSLAPAAKRLSRLIAKEVKLAPDCIGPEVQALVDAMQPGDVILLENLRFHAEEQANDENFSRQLAALAEAATELSERLVVLLRRKLLLPTLLELLANERKAANAEPPPASPSRDSSASPPLQAAPRAVASHPDELGVDAVDSPTVPHPRLSVADEGAIR